VFFGRLLVAAIPLGVTDALAVAMLTLSTPTISAGEARLAALQSTGGGEASTHRRDGDEWEVDVRRGNGSLVEVTLGPGLTRRHLDEERGVADSVAPDEVVGPRRTRAVTAALTETGDGQIRYVEREHGGTVEVRVLRPDGMAVEVEPDPRDSTVREIEAESVDDE
jgi:hypothetical protein